MPTSGPIFLSQHTGDSQEMRNSLPCTPEEGLAQDGLREGMLWSSIQSCTVSQHSVWGSVQFKLHLGNNSLSALAQLCSWFLGKATEVQLVPTKPGSCSLSSVCRDLCRSLSTTCLPASLVMTNERTHLPLSFRGLATKLFGPVPR